MHLNFFSAMLADATSSAAPAASSATTPAASAAGSAAGQPPPPGLLQSPFVFMALMAVMMYFLILRPQQQRTRQQQKLLSALKAGDKVVTASGIIGVVTSVREKSVSLRSADAKFEITKASVTEILEAGTATES